MSALPFPTPTTRKEFEKQENISRLEAARPKCSELGDIDKAPRYTRHSGDISARKLLTVRMFGDVRIGVVAWKR